MTLRRLLLASAFALALAPLSAAAQATRGSTPVPPGVNPNVPVGPGGTPVRGGAARPTHETVTGGGDTYISTRSVSGEVREVNLEEGYILVVIPKKGTGKFYVGGKTRLRADKETPLGERKRLTLEDFQKGQNVKVTFWPDNFEATEVRARQPKS
jgi:hypothetical protein